MSKPPPRCDSCNRRIRLNHHGLMLTDLMTEQRLGYYHARPGCQDAALKYITDGAALRISFVHPDRCGDEQEFCDGGLPEWAA